MYNFCSNTERVFQFIQDNPGIHLRQIKKELNVSLGTIQYHLSVLENSGRIISERQYFRRTYFPVGTFKKNERNILKILKRDNLKAILLFVMEKQNPTQTDIATGLGLSNSTVNRLLRYVIDHEIIYEIRDGRFKRYHVGDNETIVKLMKNYHPVLWRNWNQRIVGIFLSLWYGIVSWHNDALEVLPTVLEV
ncbi:MAG: winged helix-turn-helix transcriptional regulator [Thaumarchaeota archaeon]|nr:MAG: winged helix-turn-helix transcriptional regulator [Nitrososphaerota archaeon]